MFRIGSRLVFSLVLFAMFGVVGSAVGSAFGAEYGEISLQYVPLYSPLSGVSGNGSVHGCVEHRFRVVNRSATQSKKVAIHFPTHTYQDFGIRRARGSVEVPAGQTAQFVVFQPPVPMQAHSLDVGVSIDGVLQRDSLSFNAYPHCDPYTIRRFARENRFGSRGGGSHRETCVQILVSTNTPTPFRDLVSQGTAKKVEGSPPGTVPSSARPEEELIPELNLWRGEGDVHQWSDHWLAYSRFDAVVLTSVEYGRLPQPVLSALRRYVECGGTLCVLGKSWTPPKEWKRDFDFGQPDGATRFQAVYGSAYGFPQESEKSKTAIERLRGELERQSDRWIQAMQSNISNRRSDGAGFFGDTRLMMQNLPVSDSMGVPIRTISVLIVVFAVLIGPVNIYVLSATNRRIWLLWTVPVLSLLTSGCVLGINLFREGFVKNISSHTSTILDQRREEAITFGTIGYYSTFTPSGGVVFNADTEPTIIVNRSDQTFIIATAPGGTQILESGWVQPRVPAYFAIRKAESRKERLSFQWDVSPPTVLNQIGEDIDRLTVRSPEGKYFVTTNLQAGEKAELQSVERPGDSDSRNVLERFRTGFNQFDSWGTSPLHWNVGQAGSSPTLEPGSYHCTLEGKRNPFLEPGIENMKPYKNDTVIIGFFD